jgi:hypothetical protein
VFSNGNYLKLVDSLENKTEEVEDPEFKGKNAKEIFNIKQKKYDELFKNWNAKKDALEEEIKQNLRTKEEGTKEEATKEEATKEEPTKEEPTKEEATKDNETHKVETKEIIEEKKENETSPVIEENKEVQVKESETTEQKETTTQEQAPVVKTIEELTSELESHLNGKPIDP